MAKPKASPFLAMTFAILSCGPLHAQVTFRYFYDANGQLVRAVDSTGNVLEYDYDANGNPAQIQRSSVSPGSLAIFNVLPLTAQAGQTVTIYGQNFSTTPANNIVKFNGLAATVLSATAGQLTVQVPTSVTSGPITVTVASTTATFNFNFAVPAAPVITSVSPAYGNLGQQTSGIAIKGSNFTDATTFDLPGVGFASGVNIVSSTQATLNLAIFANAAPGYYALIAESDGAVSSSVLTAGNRFYVMFPPGSNTVDLKFSTFNTAYPATSDLSIPAGSNQADRKFSTFNAAYPATSDLVIPGGLNEAFRLFSTQNNATGTSSIPLSIRRNPGGGSRVPVLQTPGADGAAASAVLIAGETVEIPIGTPLLQLESLDFEVNRVPLVSSSNAFLDVWFTVPHGVDALDLMAVARTETGTESDSAPLRVTVKPDPGRTVAGRLLDANGRPVAGATVGWEADGLSAEYFRLNQSPGQVPDLAGLAPARTAAVSALNYPNPQQVFGKDPMGIGLGRNYAARFRGTLAAETSGTYQFLLHAHSGASLTIDGAMVLSTAEGLGGKDLAAGTHEIEVIYYGDDGPASLQLIWTRPGGVPEVVPPTALRTGILPASTAVTDEDGRFVLRVPAALEGVTVKPVDGQGSVELDLTNSSQERGLL